MCTDESRDAGEHSTQVRVGAQVKAGTQVSTEHISEGRDTGEHRAHRCAQVRAGMQVITGHTGVHR